MKTFNRLFSALCAAGLLLSALNGSTQTINNPSFEADNFTVSPGYVSGNGPITGWTALDGHGVNPGTFGGLFTDNGTIPDGSRAAFLQEDGALSQVISGFVVGETYQVHYFENARTGATAPSCEVQIGGITIVAPHTVTPVGGSNPYRQVLSEPFVATASEMELSFIKSNPQGGDTTLLIDHVSLILPNTPPGIIAEPQHRTVGLGDTATFTVGAVGSHPLNFQWYFGSEVAPDGTGSTLEVLADFPDVAGDYYVIVSNGAGSATSQVARLTVRARVPGLFNTGVDENGQALPDGSVDPHYTLVVNADSGLTETFVHDSTVFPIVAGPWVANTATSKWIGPRVNTEAAAGLATGDGIYRYQTTFDLTDLDIGAVTITGSWATDNEGLGIYVNGEPTGLVNNNQFASLTPFTINSTNANFVEGLNTLEFELRNTDAVAGYTGLRVTDLRGLAPLPGTPPIITVEPQDEVAEIGGQARFSVTAEGSAPLAYQWWSNGTEILDANDPSLVFTVSSTDDAGDYSVVVGNSFGSVTSVVARLTVFQPIPGVVNTGVDASGAPLDDNAVDPHYILVTNAHDSASSEAIVHDSTVFPIVAGPWVPNSATSKWIGPVFNTVAAAGGFYVYRLTVDLSDRDPATVRIVGKWATDNPGTDIRVNGVSTGNPPSPGFTAYTSFDIDSSNAAFVSGLNTIDFVLENTTVGYTGLRVEDLKSDAVALPPGTPPSISLQPQSQNARVSEDVTFTVAASGSGPLNYQWFFEGFELFEETSPTLRLLDVTPDQAGSYQVVVTGPEDSVTSNPAILTVGPALELWITTYHRLRVGGVVGSTYLIEYADDPANPVFSTLTTIVLPSDPHFIVDPAVDAPNRIYRIVPQPE